MQVEWMVIPLTVLHMDGRNEPFILLTHVTITHKELKLVYYKAY